MNDDLERFHSMWGDDGEGDGDDEGESGGKNELPLAPMSLAGLAPLFMVAPDAKDRPASDPVQWKIYEERFGFKPYDSPTTEYLDNEHPLNRQTLLYRWAGYPDEKGYIKEIELLFADHRTTGLRARRQMERGREAGLPNYSDPEWVKMETNYQIHLAIERIRAIKAILEMGVDITVEQYYRFSEGGTFFKEEHRPMSPASRGRLDRDLREWMRVYRELTGQDGSKLTHIHDVGENLRDMMLQAWEKSGAPSRSGFTVQQLREAKAAQSILPDNSVIEAEVLPIGRKTNENGNP